MLPDTRKGGPPDTTQGNRPTSTNTQQPTQAVHADRSAPGRHSVELPEPPRLSAVGRRVLAEAHQRDVRVTTECGYSLHDARTEFERMTPDEREALLLDGLRWRWHQRPEAVAARADAMDRALANAFKDVSVAFSAGHACGVSHAELERRRYPWLFNPDWRNAEQRSDPAAGRRWVLTGSSKEKGAAA